MSDKKVQATAANEADVIIERAKGFWAKFSKPIIIVGGALIVLIGGYLGYKYLYKLPNEEKANEVIIPAESLFSKMAAPTQAGAGTSFESDSLGVKILLKGGDTTGGRVTGLLDVIKKYDGTAAANRAHYMVGVIYVHQKQYDNAIKQLKEFDPNGSLVQLPYYESLATAYAELKKNDDALSYYKKAALYNEKDEYNSPIMLKKAADFAGFIGKTKDAVELYKKIKDEYPSSAQAADADKNLAKLGVTD